MNTQHTPALNIHIQLTNSAFEDSGEVSRILRNLADRIEIQVLGGEDLHANYAANGSLIDINGNKVGSVTLEGDGRRMNVEEMWDALLELGISEQTLQIVCNGWGYSTENMETILYVHTGYRDFQQLEDADRQW